MRRVGQFALYLVTSVGLAGSALAQDPAMDVSQPGPRFYYVASANAAPARLDVSRTPVLSRRITLDMRDVTLEAALEEIRRKAGLKLMYSARLIPLEKKVSIKAENITVASALGEVLFAEEVDVVFSASAQAMLVPRSVATAAIKMVGIVSGRVTDASTQQGIDGVRVFLEETRWSTTTSSTGSYRLSGVAAGVYTLVTRRLGYAGESRTVTVTDGVEANVDVSMRQLPSALQEVVVTATGEQRRLELGHVVGRINADSVVKEAPVSSLSELLTARVPGLQVFQNQGTVGGDVHVQIRGANTLLLNTEPIVIVDGVRYTNRAAQKAVFFGPGQVEATNPLNDLNPNDIETVEVVKGPSAATLYGTDAANGVLVITTKRGRSGPARWNAYMRSTRNEIPTSRFPDLYWGWGTVFGMPDNSDFNCTLGLLADGSCTQQDSITVLPNPLNDPQLTIFGTKPSWQYGMNVAGGLQDLRYYFSGDFEDATGPVQMPPGMIQQLREERGLSELPDEWRNPNTLSKLNLRGNVTAVLGETADLHVNTGYVHSATRSLGAVGTPYLAAFTGGPTTPYPPAGGVNPAEAFAQTSTARIDRFFGSASGHWRPAPWLASRATVGLDLTSRNRYSLVRSGDAPNNFFVPNGAIEDDRVRQVATTGELGATATLRRGRLSTRTSVGAQYVRNLNDGLTSFGTDLPPGGTSVGEAANVQSRQTYAETVTLGSYLEETLGLNERLFLTGALRVDGASAFGQDYDAAVYPKVSASWLLSEEPFLPRMPGLDELRLRYAYGASGQQATSAMVRPFFVPERWVENGTVTNIMVPVWLGNPGLRPERVREHEFGFDATALESRLRLGLTWYRRRTVDQITQVLLPPGQGVIYSNLGLTTQRGFEAELTARVLNTRLLSWDFTIQDGIHTTKLEDLGGAITNYSESGGWVEGYPLGARFQAPLLGYADSNGDGIIDWSEVQVAYANPVYMGESTPPRSQTLTVIAGLFERRLRVSALLERRTGFTQINNLKYFQCAYGVCRANVDPNTPLAEQAEIASFLSPIEPGDFTRLREVTAALDLPLGLARVFRMRSATLALSARNLALWTEFSGPDPESAAVSGISGGVADGIPQGRSWALRLDIGL